MIDGHGIPLSVAADAASVSETALGQAVVMMVVLVTLPVTPSAPIPVLGDRGTTATACGRNSRPAA